MVDNVCTRRTEAIREAISIGIVVIRVISFPLKVLFRVWGGKLRLVVDGNSNEKMRDGNELVRELRNTLCLFLFVYVRLYIKSRATLQKLPKYVVRWLNE